MANCVGPAAERSGHRTLSALSNPLLVPPLAGPELTPKEKGFFEHSGA